LLQSVRERSIPGIEPTLPIPKKRQLLEESQMDKEGINGPAIEADPITILEGVEKGGDHV
jgi:hypothetical protein